MGGSEAAPKGVAKENRLAIILYFKDFTHKPGAERIDALYRLLDPGKDVRLHYDVVSPSQVKLAVQGAGTKEYQEKAILRALRDKLSVSRVLVMELSQKGDRFTIHAWLKDAANGSVPEGAYDRRREWGKSFRGSGSRV